VIEALKLAFNVLARYSERSRERLPSPTQGRTLLWDASRDFEEQPLQSMAGQYDEEAAAAVSAEGGGGVGQQETPAPPAPAPAPAPDPSFSFSAHSRLAVAFASVVWAGTTYVVRLSFSLSFPSGRCRGEAFLKERIPIPQFSSALFFFDAATVHFASATSTVLVLCGFYALVGRGITIAVSQSIALQVRRRPSLRFLDHFSSQWLASGHFARPKRVVAPFAVSPCTITHLARRRFHQCL
jgi:hypothetical protein